MNDSFWLKIIALIGGCIGFIFALFQYWQKSKFEKYMKFIELRKSFKAHTSNDKIIKHIQSYQLDPTQKSNIFEFDITINDFYYFLGFFEELQILIEKGILSKKVSKKMFAFYGIEIANNNHYWTTFDENINEEYWCTFKKFIDSMKNKC